MVTVTETVEALLKTLDLDELGQARAATALVIAEKLDDARGLKAGVVMAAVPSLSRELSVVLAVLTETDEAGDFVESLFRGVR